MKLASSLIGQHLTGMEDHTISKGAESVWDYPRPPRLEPTSRRIRVEFNGTTIAETTDAFRVLETSHPPTYYIPREDVRGAVLTPSQRSSICEWKGNATYWNLRLAEAEIGDAAWSYEHPTTPFQQIKSYLAFYPDMLECYVDGERAQPQAGGFYGGWVTSHVRGPFKGAPGTRGW